MKKVKIFIKIVLLALPFIAFSLVAKFGIMGFANGDVPYFFWNKDYCKKSHSNSVVILGDSEANAAYLPDVLSDATVNLSLGGITPVETYYVMKDYLEESQPPRDVFISFADCHFWWAAFYWDYAVYSHRFTVDDYLEMINTAKEYGDEDIGNKNCFFDLLSYMLYFPNKYITSAINAKLTQRYNENVNAYKIAEKYRGSYFRAANELLYGEEKYDEFIVESLYDYYYCRIIQLCLDNECNVHIIKLPLPPTSSYTEKYSGEYNAYFDNLKKKYPEITVEWVKEGYGAEYFLDNMHLNEAGGVKFSTELKEKYKEAFN